MLKAKITYRETPIEAEADTKRDLEDALEVALNVVARLNLAPLQAYREPETLGLGAIPSVPPPEATQPLGGATPPQQSPDLPKITMRPSLRKGARTIGDHIYIILQNLAEQNGVVQGYTNREILEHLQEAGSKAVKVIRSKHPIRAIGQAVRYDRRFTRKDDLTWLTEWFDESESLPEPEETSDSLPSEPLGLLDS